jgi:4-hydroxybenzoate polyprenyltransferase
MKNIIPIVFLIATVVFLIATIIALVLDATTLGGIFGVLFIIFLYGASKMKHRMPKWNWKDKIN